MGWPIGTPDEVRAVGLDPTQVETCSPAKQTFVKDGEMIRQEGCQFWRRKDGDNQWIDCLFARDCPAVNPKVGPTKAFRGHGPRNIALYRRLDPTEIRPGELVPPSWIQFTQCFHFEGTMRTRYENQRKSGEKIAVVGVEGDGQKFPQVTIETIEDPNNPRGEKLKKKVIVELEIPPFQRPKDRFTNVELDRMAAAAVSGQYEEDIAAELADYMRKTIATEDLPVPEKKASAKKP